MTSGPTPRMDSEEPAAPDTSREPDYTVAFSPRQVAGGFAILAAIIVLLLRRRRGKKNG